MRYFPLLYSLQSSPCHHDYSSPGVRSHKCHCLSGIPGYGKKPAHLQTDPLTAEACTRGVCILFYS